jgi:Ca2+-binding EF-hand superfamily protein
MPHWFSHKHKPDYSCENQNKQHIKPSGGGGGEHYKEQTEGNSRITVSFNGVTNAPAQYKTTTTQPLFEFKPDKDDIYENMYNIGGGTLVDDQQTNGKTTMRNSATDTFLGFMSDGEMGKGSKLVVNNKKSDLKSEFFKELDKDNSGTVSHDEYVAAVNNLKNRGEKSGDYYSKGIAQFSEKKIEESYKALTGENGGEISKDDFANFINKTAKKGVSFTRNENKKDVTYNDVSEIDFADLPENVKNATKTGEQVKVKDGTTTTTKVSDASTSTIGTGKGVMVARYHWEKEKKGKEYSNIEMNPDAVALAQTFNDYKAKNNDKETIPMSELIATMEQKGVSKDKLYKLLQEGGVDPNTPNLTDIKIVRAGLPNKKIDEIQTQYQQQQEQWL